MHKITDGQPMLQIKLRTHALIDSPEDLIVQVQEATFEYLMSSPSKEIRVSAYLDRDWPRVEAMYAVLDLNSLNDLNNLNDLNDLNDLNEKKCPFESKITKIIPGSKTRSGITLPGPMKEGEQLVVIVARSPRVVLV